MREKSPFSRGSLGIGRAHRKILVVAEDAWARDTMRVLLGSMGCHCVMEPSLPVALAALGPEVPDAAIVDLQCTPSATSGGIPGLEEICRSLRGRVIILTGENHERQVAALIHRYNLPRIQRERLLQDLWGALNSLPGQDSAFRKVIRAARLIFDSFLEPAPVGIRISQLPGRRLVYEAGSFMVDLSLEPPQTDSRRMSLVGQLIDAAKPERQLDGLSVGLHGPKGPIALAPANKFGEFHFEFDAEQNVNLEIETAANQGISIVLPRLESVRERILGS